MLSKILSRARKFFFIGGRKRSPIVHRRRQLSVEVLEDRVVPVFPAFFFASSTYSVTEAVGNASIVVQRSSSTGTASIDISATDGTATSPSDYSFTSQTLNFANGQSSITVSVPIVSDSVAEPDENFTLTLSNPSTGTSLGAAYTTTVTIANRAPTVWGNSTSLSVLRNNLTDPIDLSQYASDADSDPLVFTIVTQPSHGQVNSIGGRYFIYMSAAGYTGSDSFAFKANDGAADSSNATFSLSVTNTAPTADDTGTYYTLKNQALSIGDLPTYGSSLSTTVFTPTIVAGPSHGVLTNAGSGIYVYTPTTNYVGPDSFTFTLNDGVDDTISATTSINVVDGSIVANDVRVVTPGAAQFVVSPADLYTNAKSILSNPAWSVTSLSTASLGNIASNGDGTWTYTPPENQLVGFQDSLTVTITDGTNTATETYFVLAPFRQPIGDPQPAPVRDRRAFFMPGINNLFPTSFTQNGNNLLPNGLTAAAYNGLNQGQQASLNDALASSIHQGYVGGDSAAAANLAAAIRKKGAAWLVNLFSPRIQNGNLIGYTVQFEQDPQGGGIVVFTPVNVGIPTDEQRAIFGYAGSNALGGPSLWYTVYEMAYVQQYRGAQVVLENVGLYSQPVASAADSLAALRAVAGPPNVGQSFVIANTQVNALTAQLGNANAIMTAAALTNFTQQQQGTATNFGIERATTYAVIDYSNLNNNPIVTLMSPRDGRRIEIPLDDFRDLFSTLITNA